VISALFGIIAMALGLWGTVVWRHEFLTMVRGLLPVSLFFAGLVAVITGLSGALAKPSSKPKGHGKT